MNNFIKRFRLIVALMVLPGAVMAGGPCSPIIIDLAKDGISLGARGVGVYFDVNGDYVPDHVQWVRPQGDEAFLTLDRNGNGIVDNGAELFGVGTPLTMEGGTAPNGFVALAQYDQPVMGGNDDGLISDADSIWTRLGLWRDANADGISTAGEMHTLEAAGITTLETIPKFRKYRDEAGNVIPFWARATTTSAPTTTLMVDVFFLVLEERSALCTKQPVAPASG
jgi:hypothetical protein